jgi:GMP synthase-like glutamine amidotransferase
MKLTILETGRAPGRLSADFPSYPEMFARLLGAGEISFERVAVMDNAPLPDPAACEAVLITGSPAGVYDPLPWMDPLRAFVRGVHAARTPLVGVCFGHQIIADALGGDVRKSEKGWGIGRHGYDIVEKRPWMRGAGDRFSLAASHQDQVITPPKGAVTLARSAHTDHAMLVYDDAPVMSLQGHPEFEDDFSAALYGARRGLSLTPEQADAAVDSLRQPHDNVAVGAWIRDFLRSVRG